MRRKFLTIIFLSLASAIFAQTWQFGAPFDTSAPDAIFRHVQNRVPRTSMLDSLKYPYPTNCWFKTLFWKSNVDGIAQDSMLGCNPVFTYPYSAGFGFLPYPGYNQYRFDYLRLGFGYRPWAVTVISGPAPSNNNITLSPAYDWMYGAVSTNGNPDSVNLKPFIRKYDDLSVTVKWREPGSGARWMEAPLVKGMPYVTMRYNNLIPYIASQARALLAISVDGGNLVTIGSPYMEVTGHRFLLKLGGDGGQGKCIYWVLYSSSPVTVRAYYNYHASNAMSVYQAAVVFKTPFTGFLRTAYLCAINNNQSGGIYNDSVNVQGKINLLDKFAPYFPVSGNMTASIQSGVDSVHMNFNWQTNQPASDSLLMLGLPHHFDILDASVRTDSALSQYNVIYGKMKAIEGKRWSFTDATIPFDWKSNIHNLASCTNTQYRDQLFAVLKGDIDTVLGVKVFKACYMNQIATSTYFGGKQLAKRGRLALISDELGDWYNTAALSKEIRDTLKGEINRWLDAKGQVIPVTGAWRRDTLMYETRYGGLINSLDYHSIGDDFGNSVYTDHHFHYGYFLYAAAAIAKADTAWGRAYRKKLLLFARDIANPSVSDGYFVKTRMADWFDGHSWAQGLSEAGALGNNQESTSEAVNAWYGMYLLGLALKDDNLANSAKLHLACEVRSARKYWQIGNLSQYDSNYTKNYKVIGNLYATVVNSTVAFGTTVGDPRLIYGIQQIPVTPVNNILLPKSWCDLTWQFYYKNSNMMNNPLSGSESEINLQWGGVNTSAAAISNPGFAYQYWSKYLKAYKFYSSDSTLNIVNYDDGQTKTNLLYNAIVNAPSNLMAGKINFNVTVNVLSNDTLGSCKGSINTNVSNLSQGIPPYYYYLFGPTGQVAVTPDTNGMITGLCAGYYTLEVIDQQFNEGNAEFSITYPQGTGNSASAGEVHVWPNPSANASFNLEWDAKIRSVRTEVNTSAGSKLYDIKKQLTAPGRMVLSLGDVPSGVYILNIWFDNGKSANIMLSVVR